MKLYLYKKEYYSSNCCEVPEFVICTVPCERWEGRGWGNTPKAVTLARRNKYGYRDETAPYGQVVAGPFELNSHAIDNDLMDTNWLEILVTTGFTKAMVMEFLKKGKYANYRFENTADTL